MRRKSIKPIKYSIALLAAAGLAAAAACASGNNLHQENTRMTNTSDALTPFATLTQPASTHAEVNRQSVSVDGEKAVLTRYERRDQRNNGLGGEHFSTVFDTAGLLKGFANISIDLAGKPLPSRERTEQIARAFLQNTAPELLPRMKISWIEPHDESIQVTGERGEKATVTLTGMKMKARNLADGRWFWVIIGSNEQPMVFERDIVWINFPGHRKTEKWLHDNWRQENAAALATGTKTSVL